MNDLGIGACGAVHSVDDDSCPCVLDAEHTIHQDLLGNRWTVKKGLVLELPRQRSL